MHGEWAGITGNVEGGSLLVTKAVHDLASDMIAQALVVQLREMLCHLLGLGGVCMQQTQSEAE